MIWTEVHKGLLSENRTTLYRRARARALRMLCVSAHTRARCCWNTAALHFRRVARAPSRFRFTMSCGNRNDQTQRSAQAVGVPISTLDNCSTSCARGSKRNIDFSHFRRVAGAPSPCFHFRTRCGNRNGQTQRSAHAPGFPISTFHNCSKRIQAPPSVK